MSSRKWSQWVIGNLLCLITFLVWLPTLKFGFVYDDHGQILENPRLQSWSCLGQYFRQHTWAHLPWMPASFYRPLYLVWLRVNYVFFKTDAQGWHLASVLLHVAVTMLVFVLARRLLRENKAAALAAIIFGLHPAHAESVAWISGNTDPLLAVFVLAAILSLERSGKENRWPILAAVAFYGTGLLIKETALVALPAILIWMRMKDEDIRGPRFAIAAGSFIVTTLVYLLVRQAVLGNMVSHTSAVDLSLSWRTLPSLALFYTKHLLWPAQLSGFYDISLVHSLSLREFWLPLTLLLVGAGFLAGFARDSRITRHEGAFYLALALLIAPLVPAFYLPALEPGNFAHDRYLYIPIAGFALLIALAFRSLSQSWPRLARPMLVLFCGMALAYGLFSIREGKIWRDDLSLFTRAAQVAPNNSVAKLNLASEWIRQQRCTDAVPLLQQVIQRAPEMWFAHANLANCYLENGQEAKAETELSIAVELQPLPELVQRLQLLRAQSAESTGASQGRPGKN